MKKLYYTDNYCFIGVFSVNILVYNLRDFFFKTFIRYFPMQFKLILGLLKFLNILTLAEINTYKQ